MIHQIFSFLRLSRAGWVLLRSGVFHSLPLKNLSGTPSILYKSTFFLAKKAQSYSDTKRLLAKSIYKLGPTYIKLGQFLSTRPDIVGQKLAENLSSLQDNLDFFSISVAKKCIEDSLEAPVESLFFSIDAPIAAASIAQAHPACIKCPNGELKKVAVKVIRPGIKQNFNRDFSDFYFAASLQKYFVPSLKRFCLKKIVSKLEYITKIEMDLRLEAAALSEMAENIKMDTGFRVPDVDWTRTGRDVLTISWVDGIKISDIQNLKRHGFNLNQLSATLMQSFLRHALRDGFFHADLHQGNLFVDFDGNLTAIDFGIMGRLNKEQRRFLAEILYGFINKDYLRVAEVHLEAEYVPNYYDAHSFSQAIRAIAEPIYGQSAETISMGHLLGLLFEITDLFDMKARPELFLLQKSMIVVEGICRTLNPHFNMWETSRSVVKEWILENLGPSAKLKKTHGELLNLGKKILNLPNYLEQRQIFEEQHLALSNKTQTQLERLNRIFLYFFFTTTFLSAIIAIKIFV